MDISLALQQQQTRSKLPFAALAVYLYTGEGNAFPRPVILSLCAFIGHAQCVCRWYPPPPGAAACSISDKSRLIKHKACCTPAWSISVTDSSECFLSGIQEGGKNASGALDINPKPYLGPQSETHSSWVPNQEDFTRICSIDFSRKCVVRRKIQCLPLISSCLYSICVEGNFWQMHIIFYSTSQPKAAIYIIHTYIRIWYKHTGIKDLHIWYTVYFTYPYVIFMCVKCI